MKQIESEYRGLKITFDPGSSKHEEKWKSELGEDWIEKNSYHDITKKIDDFIKRESEHAKKEVIVFKWRKLQFAILTSEDRNGEDVWIKYDDGKREKASKKYIYKYNDKNKEIIKQMNKFDQQIDELNKQIGLLTNSLDKEYELDKDSNE